MRRTELDDLVRQEHYHVNRPQVTLFDFSACKVDFLPTPILSVGSKVELESGPFGQRDVMNIHFRGDGAYEMRAIAEAIDVFLAAHPKKG